MSILGSNQRWQPDRDDGYTLTVLTRGGVSVQLNLNVTSREDRTVGWRVDTTVDNAAGHDTRPAVRCEGSAPSLDEALADSLDQVLAEFRRQDDTDG